MSSPKEYTADELWAMTRATDNREGLVKEAKKKDRKIKPYVKVRTFGREGLEDYEDAKEHIGIEAGIKMSF